MVFEIFEISFVLVSLLVSSTSGANHIQKSTHFTETPSQKILKKKLRLETSSFLPVLLQRSRYGPGVYPVDSCVSCSTHDSQQTDKVKFQHTLLFFSMLSRALRIPRVAMIQQLCLASNLFNDHTPAPPRLPKEQQEEFELLQKMANSQAAIDEYNRQIEETGSANSDFSTPQTDVGVQTQYFKTVPEFEGDRNPETGEVGGPKQDPLRHNDWSFNGRVTDF